MLVSLGRDENGPKIKAWNCGSSNKPPVLLRALDCFPAKQDATEISLMAVHNSWPQLVYALGLANGNVILLRADTGTQSYIQKLLRAPLACKASSCIPAASICFLGLIF